MTISPNTVNTLALGPLVQTDFSFSDEDLDFRVSSGLVCLQTNGEMHLFRADDKIELVPEQKYRVVGIEPSGVQIFKAGVLQNGNYNIKLKGKADILTKDEWYILIKEIKKDTECAKRLPEKLNYDLIKRQYFSV